MIYSKKQLHAFTNKMYALFKESPEIFALRKLSHGVHGWCFYGEDEKEENILIDYRRDLLAALIHETIHYLHNDWAEGKVVEMETNILNQLSISQIKNIIKRFAAIL